MAESSGNNRHDMVKEGKKREHRLRITLADVAAEARRTMNEIYADIKRDKLDKDSLASIIEYVVTNRAKRDGTPGGGIIL